MQPRAVLTAWRGRATPGRRLTGAPRADVRVAPRGRARRAPGGLARAPDRRCGGHRRQRPDASCCPAESTDPDPGAFLLAAAEVREQTLGQWVWEHTFGFGGGLFGTASSVAASPRIGVTERDRERSVAHRRRGRRSRPRGDRGAGPHPGRRGGLLSGDAIITIDGRPPMRQTLDLNLATGNDLPACASTAAVRSSRSTSCRWRRGPNPAGGGATYVRRAADQPAARARAGQGAGRLRGTRPRCSPTSTC